jgi:hypothetical protein
VSEPTRNRGLDAEKSCAAGLEVTSPSGEIPKPRVLRNDPIGRDLQRNAAAEDGRFKVVVVRTTMRFTRGTTWKCRSTWGRPLPFHDPAVDYDVDRTVEVRLRHAERPRLTRRTTPKPDLRPAAYDANCARHCFIGRIRDTLSPIAAKRLVDLNLLSG